MRSFQYSVFSVALLALALNGARGIAKAEEPAIRITVKQDIEPAEATAGDEVRFRLNFNVADAEGNPVALGQALDVQVDLPLHADEDSQLSIAAAQDTFHFGAGFQGGTRVLVSAVNGVTPKLPALLSAPVTFTALAPGFGLTVPETLKVQVRAAPGEPDGEFHFCPQPGRGEIGVNEPLLYADFRRCLVIGHVSALGKPAATVLAGVQVEIREQVAGGLVAQPYITLSDALTRTVVDSDGDGIAEGVNLTLRLEALADVPVAINATRRFVIRAEFSDGINSELLGEALFLVERRERAGAGRICVIGHDHLVVNQIERRQSRALNPQLTLMRNGVAMDAAARATVTIQPQPGNAQPDAESGLYNLAWRTEVDWPRLQKLVPWGAGDTLTVRFQFSGALGAVDVSSDVMSAGIEATVFKTPQELLDKVYDGGTTEKAHVDALVAALKAAGIRARENPNRLEWPGVLADPNEIKPNWDRVDRAILATKAAINTYKKAARVRNGVDALTGQKTWEVEIDVEFDVVDAAGNPVLNPDGSPRKLTVKLKIVFNPQTDGAGNGGDAKGDDKKQANSLLIVIAQCGNTVGDNAGNGGNAVAEVKGPGSIGIAAGGDGQSNADEDKNIQGGKGGKATATAGDAGRQAGQPGPTGVAIGGRGGSTVGTGALPGDGGDAEGKGVKGGRARVVARGGDSGNGKIPPREGEYKGGKATAENPDAVGTGEKGDKTIKKETGTCKMKGRAGQCPGGTARSEAGETPDSSDGAFKPASPVTGD